jgi:hypothetical protein
MLDVPRHVVEYLARLLADLHDQAGGDRCIERDREGTYDE